MPAHSDQQGGQSGKIHFIESTLFILALVAAFAPKRPASGPWGARGWGRLHPLEEHTKCPKGPDLQQGCGF